MNKWRWKVFSITTILALALALCPTAAVNAAPGDDDIITGIIDMAQPPNNPGAGFYVDAYPEGGGDSCWGPTTWDGVSGHYDYEMTNCDGTKKYTVVANGSGYTFDTVTVLAVDFVVTGPNLTAVAQPITPVDRVLSGHVYKPDGSPWVGFDVYYELDGAAATFVTTNGSGVYTIPDVTDASRLFFPRIELDGYDFGGGNWWINPPLQRDITDVNFASRGTRNLNGRIESMSSLQGCKADVTITVAPTFPRVYTNDPAAGSNIVLYMNDTSGFSVNDFVIVSSSAGEDNTIITSTTPATSRAYTNNPAAGSNIVLAMANTSGFNVGDFVIVSSSAGSESTTIVTVTANTSITVAALTRDHATGGQVTRPSITVATLALNHPAGGQVTAPNGLTQTTLTNGDGNFNLNNLEPLYTYVVTPSKIGCAFTPESQHIDIRNGDLNRDIVFQVPSTGVYGTVKSTLGDSTGTNYASLAYYLIATYTVDGVSYSNSVNWADGSYWINVPPNTGGTLTISRVGGPAAFGYDTAVVTDSDTGIYVSGPTQTPITLADTWKEVNFTLVPSRTISGTLVGQNSVPVQKNAMVDFGYWLHWRQPGTLTAYSIKAQPKLYYLSPVENGIASSTPVRLLANLTAAPSFTTANFTFTLKTYLLEGCLSSYDSDNESLVLPSVFFRPAAGYGATITAATLDVNNESRCGLNGVYYSMRLPRGIVGALEAVGHTLQGNTIDGITNDRWEGYSVFGNRSITGRVYNFSPNLNINFDPSNFNGGGLLVLRDAATNAIVNRSGNMEISHEFTIPMLESKAYTLSINQDRIPEGYDAQPFPMSPIVTANLTTTDVDIPAASGFVLVHKPIDPASATGGGYFFTPPVTTEQDVVWDYPPLNQSDRNRFIGFKFQVGLATTPFTDTLPVPTLGYYNPNRGDTTEATFTGLTANTLYRWRVRAVYETDEGPWMETAPRPTTAPTNPATTPTNWGYLSGAAAPVTFQWNEVVPAGTPPTTPRYVLQYSDTPAFTVATLLTTTPGTTSATTASALATGKTWYWRVKTQYNTTGITWVDISGWSPIQAFFNRYQALTGPAYQWVDIGWNPNPIRFLAANPNTSLPADAYYQVQLSTNSFATNYTFTFNRMAASGTVPSARQRLDNLLSGSYDWRIRIVYGNDDNAKPMTDWTVITADDIPR